MEASLGSITQLADGLSGTVRDNTMTLRHIRWLVRQTKKNLTKKSRMVKADGTDKRARSE